MIREGRDSHYRSALGLSPVGGRWLAVVLGTAARVIRTDRILDEVITTGGDARRICDLFGMSVEGAERYTAVLDHPDFAELDR